MRELTKFDQKIVLADVTTIALMLPLHLLELLGVELSLVRFGYIFMYIGLFVAVCSWRVLFKLIKLYYKR